MVVDSPRAGDSALHVTVRAPDGAPPPVTALVTLHLVVAASPIDATSMDVLVPVS